MTESGRIEDTAPTGEVGAHGTLRRLLHGPMRVAPVLLAVLVGCAPPARGQDVSAVDAVIEDSLAQIGGGAALLILHDGEVVHRRGYGTFSADAVALTASAAKWLSGSVIGSLLTDGTLTLDDSLAQFFPALDGPKRRITVRQLFSHTSGIRGSREDDEPETCLGDRTITLAECADQILALPLVAEPGAELRYGGNSMQVAGRVAEIASGQAWEVLFATRIAGPLGLRRTDYLGTSNPRVAGGMVTTVDDYGAVLQMLLDGGLADGERVLSEEVVAAMLADQTRGAEIVETPYETYAGTPGLPPAGEIRYGVGAWGERIAADGTFLDVSSQGAFGLSPWIDRERGVAGVLLVQDVLSDVMGTYLDVKRLVRLALDGDVASESHVESGPSVTVRPNPARRWAVAAYTLRQPGPVEVAVLDATGRRVAVAERGERAAGPHRVRLDLRDLAAGAYRVVVTTGSSRSSRPLVVVR